MRDENIFQNLKSEDNLQKRVLSGTVSNNRAMYSLKNDETPDVVPWVNAVSLATNLK